MDHRAGRLQPGDGLDIHLEAVHLIRSRLGHRDVDLADLDAASPIVAPARAAGDEGQGGKYADEQLQEFREAHRTPLVYGEANARALLEAPAGSSGGSQAGRRP